MGGGGEEAAVAREAQRSDGVLVIEGVLQLHVEAPRHCRVVAHEPLRLCIARTRRSRPDGAGRRSRRGSRRSTNHSGQRNGG